MITCNKQIKAVLFDLDGVLLDTPQYHFIAWQWVMERLGAEITERECFLLEGQKAEDILYNLLKGVGKETPKQGLHYWVGQKRKKYHQVADVNCSITVDISDAVFTINYIFNGGPAPCASGFDHRPDNPTLEGLEDCSSYRRIILYMALIWY